MEGGNEAEEAASAAPGSAAAATTTTTGVQLRTSVRVWKKLKHDSAEIASGAGGTAPAPGSLGSFQPGAQLTSGTGATNPSIGCAHSSPNTGSASAPDKKSDAAGSTVTDGDPGGCSGAGIAGGAAATGGSDEKRKARRRAPVLWSPEDKAAFFEALNENGKNFEAIQKYMTGKAKKRGDHSTKNREQARCFYYRTWHKLAKHIKMPQNIKKVTQELYSLINFGELRKKVGKVTEKNAQKLNELIYCGSTQVRVRGKTWRIKTPLCRALRKLNQMEESVKEVKLPLRVEVVLRGRENRDAARVQGVGHNPRVKTSLPLETSLQSLVAYLDHRWTLPRLRTDHIANNTSPTNTGHQLPKSTEGSVVTGDGELLLTVGPRKCDCVSHPGYRCGPIVTSSSLSLLEHEKRIGGQHDAIRALLSQLQVGKPKSALLKWQKDDNPGDGYLGTDILDPAAPTSVANLPATVAPLGITGSGTNTQALATVPNSHDNPKDIKSSGQGNENPGLPNGENANSVSAETLGGGPAPDETKEEFEARIRRGWNKHTSSRIRIGELYIMFGSNGVINLDYWWEEPAKKREDAQDGFAVGNDTTIKSANTIEFSKALLKLLSLARLYYTKSKVECPCGHVCKTQVKPHQSNVNSRQVKGNRGLVGKQQQQTKEAVTPHAQPNKSLLHQVSPNSLTPLNDVVTNIDTARLGGGGLVEGRGLVRSTPSGGAIFKQPLLPAPGPTPVSDTYKTLQQFRPKYCNRRGRGGRKSVVVQRMLPLLPKTAPGASTGASPLVVTLQVIPQHHSHHPIRIQPTPIQPAPPPSGNPEENGNVNAGRVATTNMEVDKVDEQAAVSAANCLPTPPGSTASSLSLLSLSLPQADEATKTTTFTGVLGNTNNSGGIVTPVDGQMLLIGGNASTEMMMRTGQPASEMTLIGGEVGVGCGVVDVSIGTPPTSPSRILKEGESQWLNSEVSDFSLSSFLGQLESSPLKVMSTTNGSVQPCVSEDTRLSADVESHFQSLMAESSLDYTAKFADLAERIAASSSVSGGNSSAQLITANSCTPPVETGHEPSATTPAVTGETSPPDQPTLS